jgi:hypothetical protein
MLFWSIVIGLGAIFIAVKVIGWSRIINWFRDRLEMFQSNPNLKRIALLEDEKGLVEALGDKVKGYIANGGYVSMDIIWDEKTETVKDYEILNGTTVDSEVVERFGNEKMILFNQ